MPAIWRILRRVLSIVLLGLRKSACPWRRKEKAGAALPASARASAALTSSCVRFFACKKAIRFSIGAEATLGSRKTGKIGISNLNSCW